MERVLKEYVSSRYTPLRTKYLFYFRIIQLKIDQRVFLTPSKRKLDVNVVQSNFHIELTPSDVGNYDRVVIQDLLKEIAQTQQVDLNAKQRFKGTPVRTSDFQTCVWIFPANDVTPPIVVVINEADSLSRDAQAALRRTMEKYMSNMRMILCANSTSRLIAPIKSRCLLIRVAAPNPGEVGRYPVAPLAPADASYHTRSKRSCSRLPRTSGLICLRKLRRKSPRTRTGT